MPQSTCCTPRKISAHSPTVDCVENASDFLPLLYSSHCKTKSNINNAQKNSQMHKHTLFDHMTVAVVVARLLVKFDPAISGIREQFFVHCFLISLKSRIKSTIIRATRNA